MNAGRAWTTADGGAFSMHRRCIGPTGSIDAVHRRRHPMSVPGHSRPTWLRPKPPAESLPLGFIDRLERQPERYRHGLSAKEARTHNVCGLLVTALGSPLL